MSDEAPARRMIFHAPYPLDPGATSASGIRPVRMRRAFERAGYEVFEITGDSRERRRLIAEAKRRIEAGERFDFVYAESSTMPAFMTDRDHLPRHPLLDASFFRWCERRGLRVGLFYRDIYWRFPIYAESVRWPLSAVMRALYRWELRQYRRAGVTVFLPSLEMAERVPIIPAERFAELPPGGDVAPVPAAATSDEDRAAAPLRLLYVGGLGSNYRLLESVREIAAAPGVELTICTRPGEWERHRAEYEPVMGDRVHVVHRSGDELAALYAEADACLLAVEPIVYWGFAVPMKLVEYIGFGKPVIASDGTYSARFVREQGVGWVVDYGSGQLIDLLAALIEEPQELAARTARVESVRGEHSWEARARQAAAVLGA